MSVRILLVDDHKVLREGLRSLLDKQTETEVVGEASNGRDAIDRVRQLKPDVVIMDVNMPDMDGVDATRMIKTERPQTKVLALSMYRRKTFISEMFRNGASGYLLKEDAFAEILQAIKAILPDGKYICNKVADLLIDECLDAPADAADGTRLTEREIQVIRMLADGKASKEIAFATNVSVKTVDACRRRIMKKLNIHSLADLVKYAIREGLTRVDS